MDQEQADPSLFGDQKHPLHRVGQNHRPDTLSFGRLFNRQSGQAHRRDRVAGHSARRASGRLR
jgi:hypothetical protein